MIDAASSPSIGSGDECGCRVNWGSMGESSLFLCVLCLSESPMSFRSFAFAFKGTKCFCCRERAASKVASREAKRSSVGQEGPEAQILDATSGFSSSSCWCCYVFCEL